MPSHPHAPSRGVAVMSEGTAQSAASVMATHCPAALSSSPHASATGNAQYEPGSHSLSLTQSAGARQVVPPALPEIHRQIPASVRTHRARSHPPQRQSATLSTGPHSLTSHSPLAGVQSLYSQSHADPCATQRPVKPPTEPSSQVQESTGGVLEQSARVHGEVGIQRQTPLVSRSQRLRTAVGRMRARHSDSSQAGGAGHSSSCQAQLPPTSRTQRPVLPASESSQHRTAGAPSASPQASTASQSRSPPIAISLPHPPKKRVTESQTVGATEADTKKARALMIELQCPATRDSVTCVLENFAMLIARNPSHR